MGFAESIVRQAVSDGISCNVSLNTVLSEPQRAVFQNRDSVRAILNNYRRVAIVGLSTDSQKASYFVGSYFRYAGWEVIPVNPRAETILGLKAYPDLKSIPGTVDVVDIFRPAAEVGPIVDDAIAIGAKAVWQQLRINNLEAAEKALKAGLFSIVDLCMKMEHGRYGGGLHESGMNTELVHARREHRFL
jgi:predicted CoA-binding protein